MQVSFLIKKSQFEQVMSEFTLDRETDYYTSGGGKYTQSRSLGDENLGKFLRSPVREFIDSSHGFEYASIRPGYTISENGAMYATSALNCWGVISDGYRHQVFYVGARSRIQDMPFFKEMHESREVPYHYKSTFGSMEWFDTQASYVIRELDAQQAAELIVAECGGIPGDDNSQSMQDIYHHFIKENDDFVEMMKKAAGEPA